MNPKEVLDAMNLRESKILRMKIGIDCEWKTYGEIASAMGLTRDRVVEIYTNAVERFIKAVLTEDQVEE